MQAHTKALFHTVLLLTLVASIGFVVIKTPALTGLAVQEKQEQQTYAHTLNDRITRFFGVYAIDFPRGQCTAIAEELYNELAFKTTEITSGYSTTGKERLATINFGVERTESLGTVDLVKGKTITGNEDTDSYISMHTESVIRLPKKERLTFFALDIYGTTDELFTVRKGRFSTPAVDCEFTAQNGIADCKCSTHPIKGFTTD